MKIALYDLLVLRGRRNYLCLEDHALVIYLIPMIENTAWRFRAAIPHSGSWLKLYSCPLWRFVFIDNAQRFVAGIEDLDCPHDYALEWIATLPPESGSKSRFFCNR